MEECRPGQTRKPRERRPTPRLCKVVQASVVALAVITSLPVIAQEKKLKISVANKYPNSLPIVGDAGPKYAERLKRVSGGTIEMKFHEPGALVPALQSIQAVSEGSVEAAWSSPGFFAGTDSAFNMFSTVPFGPAVPEYLAWIYYGGGRELQDELFA